MKLSTFSIIILLLFSHSIFAQQPTSSWKVQLHKTIIDDTVLQKNVSISLAHLKAKQILLLQYLPIDDKPNWRRDIMIMNEQRQQLLKTSLCNQQFCISISSLKQLTKDSSFSIYTVQLPINAEEAKRIRIAPKKIATFIWKE
ncbi:MAG: hypothetical protein ACOVNY_13640 [Chitinophagaceae bacterium]